MLFNSLTFWIFFPIFFALYFATKGSARLWVCLLASYLFYGWWDWRFLGLIGALTGINYWCGLKIASAEAGGGWRRHYVRFSVVCSLGILGFFKYFNFFVDSFAGVASALGLSFNAGTMAIILPVGISFYTFQTMSYTIDLYRREVEVERSFLKFAVFVSFFPQLVAGPIVRAREFLPQLQSDRVVEWMDLQRGINMVLWGLVLKVVMADNLAVVADIAFADPGSKNGLFLLVGVVFYSFQIYGDFAGYSLMAIGFARMLGFTFNINFNRPYLATSFSDFWKRWHISLSSWLRDYLYIPLGGNRKGPRRTQINLMLTMLLGGLWHGAAWTFVVWGGLHGLFLVLQRVVQSVFKQRLPALVSSLAGWVLVLLGVGLTWIFFRAQSFADAFDILHKLSELSAYSFSQVTQKFLVVKGAALIALVFVVELLTLKLDYSRLASRLPVLNLAFATACLILIAFAGMFGGSAFIYFQF